jgi:chromosome segregation ATPase
VKATRDIIEGLLDDEKMFPYAQRKQEFDILESEHIKKTTVRNQELEEELQENKKINEELKMRIESLETEIRERDKEKVEMKEEMQIMTG